MHATTADRYRGVTLLHTLPAPQSDLTHHDWMLEDPTQPPGVGNLITFRVAKPMRAWPDSADADARPIYIEQIQPHRRAYLDYEGDLTGNRGRVERVETFTFTVEHWADDAATVNIVDADWQGTVTLRREQGSRWIAERVVA